MSLSGKTNATLSRFFSNFCLGLFHKITSFALNQTRVTVPITNSITNIITIDEEITTDGIVQTTDSELTTAGSTTQEPCVAPFEIKGGYCYFVEASSLKTWQNAENDCISKGPNVHLASLETPQVRCSAKLYGLKQSTCKHGKRGYSLKIPHIEFQ